MITPSGMPPKTSKSRRASKSSRPLGRSKGYIGAVKKLPKPLPDTSRIPWFPAIPKTGMDA